MIIGIDSGIRSRGYAEAARRMRIPYRLIDCADNGAIKKIGKVDALIWHWTQDRFVDKEIAFHIIKCAEIMGKPVYPNSKTCWMFDNKIAEKYLLEAVGAPLVDTFVFYDAGCADRWLKNQKYPIVYKLPQGAGSKNVRLIHSYEEGKRICKVHFGTFGNPVLGMRLYYSDYRDYPKVLKDGFGSNEVSYGINGKGSILFQKYLEGNNYDIRVTVIGEKSIIFKRLVREQDFRASGSGRIDYCVTDEDLQAIPIAQEIAGKIGSQSMAFDFLRDVDKTLKINEISYGFSPKAVYRSDGWYDRQLNFHKGHVDIFESVLNGLLKELGEGV